MIQSACLKEMTFAGMGNHPHEETEGVGKQKGILYRTADIEAIDDAGLERSYRVRVSCSGKVSVVDRGKTRKQIDKEIGDEWAGIPEAFREEVEKVWPKLNLFQKCILGKMIDGRKVHEHSAIAVIGGAARHAFMEMFPGVDTYADVCRVMKAHGERLKEECEWPNED